jgi:orotidine-5'-phosphate decarboxylase
LEAKDRIICALDVDNAYRAIQLVSQLESQVGVFKVGLELVTATGVEIFDKLRDAGAERIFYDAKLHDIPNTIAGAMRGVVRLGAWCVTVHTTGGTAMLRASVEAARREAEAYRQPAPKILGVTVLTSISPDALRDELEVGQSLPDYVAHLARLAYESGCDGVIASPQEIEAVRAAVPAPEFLVVTPGVRPVGVEPGDQARVMTPGEAIRRGAGYLVIGRPIVASPDPIQAAQVIAAEIAAALAG